MMKSLVQLSLVACAGAALGCSYHARSPEQYRDDTAALLDTQQTTVKQCYDTLLKTDPTVSGRVAIKFTVKEETGVLENPAIDPANTTAPETLSQCVLQAVSSLKLQPPDERDGHATFVYEFRPNTPGATTTTLPSG